MAGIFSPQLTSQVKYEQPVQEANAAASVFNFLATGAEGLSRARDRAEREAAASAPSYTERKDIFETEQKAEYSDELDSLQQKFEQGSITEKVYNSSLTSLDIKFGNRGINVNNPEFSAVKESITGQPIEMFARTEAEILVNNLSLTPEGQGEVNFARLSLIQQGIEQPTTEELAAQINSREVTKIAVDNIKITDALEWQNAQPVLKQLQKTFLDDTRNAFNALDQEGVPITGEMLQTRYLDFLTLKSELNAKVPSSIDTADRAQFDKEMNNIEETFKQLGISTVEGRISILPQDTLEAQNKVKLAINLLNKSDLVSDMMLAQGILGRGYELTPNDVLLLDQRLPELAETGMTAEDVPSPSIVTTNGLMSTYANLIEFQKPGGAADIEKAKVSAVSLLNPDEQAKWNGMTNAQGWVGTKAYGIASKGFNSKAILEGDESFRNGFFQNIAGLALSFEQINILEEPVSFKGVREEVRSDLPQIIKSLKSVDPVKGEALEAMIYRSFGAQKAQYDQRIRSDASTMGFVFDETKRVYNIDANTTDPDILGLRTVVDKYYGGDVSKAYADKFESITSADVAGVTGKGMMLAKPAGGDIVAARNKFLNLLPKEADFKQLLDMRSSSVYLSRLAAQIEPEAYVAEREAMALARRGEQPVGARIDPFIEIPTTSNDSAVVNTIGESVRQGDVNRAVDVIAPRDDNMEVNAPEIGVRGLGSQDTEVGTKENPYDTPRTSEEFDRIPIGGLFIGLNGEIRTKRKERNK